MAAAAKELCRRNGIELQRIPVKHRIADAAIGAEIGADAGSIGAQLKRHGAESAPDPRASAPLAGSSWLG